MTDPYRFLGETLTAAARRQEASASASAARRRGWLPRHLNAVAIALLLVLGGAAVALAASGLLNGSPVPEPQGAPAPNAGTGVSTVGGARLLALRAADPEGGPPWGMRLVHTTRGELCVQIGRVQGGQLGQLGIDGAFHDDGRFHPLSANTLPNYTSGYANLICLLPGELMLGYGPTQDRNAEWGVGRGPGPSAQQLRAISWGLLGPHAVSVTYRTSSGPRTIAVSPGTGAYMIVQPLRNVPAQITIGGFQTGSASRHGVSIMVPGLGARGPGSLSRIVYRFGSFVCAVGRLARGERRCPAPRPIRPRLQGPVRNLHERVRVRAVAQSHAICNAEYLLYPCYRAELYFKAPYAVTSAASQYDVTASSSCHNATPSSWSIDRNIRRGETVVSMSLGEFNCLSDAFEVEYANSSPQARASQLQPISTIVGTGVLGKPGRPRSRWVRVSARR